MKILKEYMVACNNLEHGKKWNTLQLDQKVERLRDIITYLSFNGLLITTLLILLGLIISYLSYF